MHTRTSLSALSVLLVGLSLASCAAEPCSVVDNGDGTHTITCPDGTSTNITDGAAGADGTTGTDGTDGTNGTDGTSCTVVDNGDSTKTITCDDGTNVVIRDGDAVFGDVTGTVSLVDTTEPRDGVAISLVNDEDGTVTTTTTDELGRYAFDDVRAGLYSVVASHAGYDARTTPNVVVADGVAVVPPMQLIRAAFVGDFAFGNTISADGTALTFVDNRLIHRFDRENGVVLVTEAGIAIGFTPDSRYLIGFGDGDVFVHDGDTDALLRFPANTIFIEDNSTHMFTATDSTLTRVELATGTETTITASRPSSNGSFRVASNAVLFADGDANASSFLAQRFSDGRKETIATAQSSVLADSFVAGSRIAIRDQATVLVVDISTTPFTVFNVATDANDLLGITNDGRFVFVRKANNRVVIHDLNNAAAVDFGTGHTNIRIATTAPAFTALNGANVVHARVQGTSPLTETAVGDGQPRITNDGSVVLFTRGTEAFARALPGTPVAVGTFANAPLIELNGLQTLALVFTSTSGSAAVDLDTLTSTLLGFSISRAVALDEHFAVEASGSVFAVGPGTIEALFNPFGFGESATVVPVPTSGVLVVEADGFQPLKQVRYFDDVTGELQLVSTRATSVIGGASNRARGAVIEQRGDCAGCTDDGNYLFTAPAP